MARNIAANATEGWRAVLIFQEMDSEGNIETFTEYQGIYNNEAAAKGRVTYWKNWTEWKIKREDSRGRFLVKGWTERATLDWQTPTPE